MTKRKDDRPPAEAVDRARGAAQEAIGKLIGDDAAVRKGRAAKKADQSPSTKDG